MTKQNTGAFDFDGRKSVVSRSTKDGSTRPIVGLDPTAVELRRADARSIAVFIVPSMLEFYLCDSRRRGRHAEGPVVAADG